MSAISLGEVAGPLTEFKNFVGEVLCLPEIFLMVFQTCLDDVLGVNFETYFFQLSFFARRIVRRALAYASLYLSKLGWVGCFLKML